MHTLAVFVLASTALSTCVSAAALPVQPSTRVECPDENPQYQAVQRNQSLIFGYQLAGSALNSTEADDTCTQVSASSASTWSARGLVLSSAQAPICASSPFNASSALPEIVQSSSQIFTSLLLNSFSAQAPASVWSFLCTNLRFEQLASFLLDDHSIVNATCTAAALSLPPEPVVPLSGPPSPDLSDAHEAVRNANSALYALHVATALNSSSTASCASAPLRKADWTALQLNASRVEEELCAFASAASLAPEDVRSRAARLEAQAFIGVLKVASNVQEWMGWLCQHLSVNGLESVGMNGTWVKGEVCK